MDPVTGAPASSRPGEDWSVDELAQRAGLPVRTIREYQSRGLVHPPRRSGRVGLYDSGHLRRLQLIGRLQDRGYSLAGIADLLAAWREGDAITDVLGLESDQLVHVDEPGVPASAAGLAAVVPSLVPDRLEDLVASGVIEHCGPDRYCVPSPSLLQLTVDALDAGLDPDAVLELLNRIRDAADTVTDAVLGAVVQLPPDAPDATIDALVGKGRGLLAHGVGRLSLHRLGRRLGVDDHAERAQLTERLRVHVRRAAGETGTPGR